MKRETFVAILGAALAEADDSLLVEASNLVQGRWRTLRQEKVQRFAPGDYIEYLARDGQTRKVGVVDHLNKFSVSIRRPSTLEGYTVEVVGIERVLRQLDKSYMMGRGDSR